MEYGNLRMYIEQLLGRGDLIFSKMEIGSAMNLSDNSIRSAIKRHVENKSVVKLSRGWYLALPLEYRAQGFVPPEQFIDDFMNALDRKYYVCLLSAASFYGATHQASQVFQVMVEREMKPLHIGNVKIQFIVNSFLQDAHVQELKTDRGPLTLSSPENTIVDLLKYPSQSGNLNHIATVISEISEHIDHAKLRNIVKKAPLLSLQRLGFILEKVGERELRNIVKSHIDKERAPKFYSPLNPGSPSDGFSKDKNWHLIVNEEIEADV